MIGQREDNNKAGTVGDEEINTKRERVRARAEKGKGTEKEMIQEVEEGK